MTNEMRDFINYIMKEFHDDITEIDIDTDENNIVIYMKNYYDDIFDL